MCVRAHAYMYCWGVCVCAHACIHVLLGCVRVCMHVHTCTGVCVCARVCIHVLLRYVCVCARVCTCTAGERLWEQAQPAGAWLHSALQSLRA